MAVDAIENLRGCGETSGIIGFPPLPLVKSPMSDQVAGNNWLAQGKGGKIYTDNTNIINIAKDFYVKLFRKKLYQKARDYPKVEEFKSGRGDFFLS